MKHKVSQLLGLFLALVLLLAIIVGFRVGLAHHGQQTAITEFERLGGVVSLKNGGPNWLRQILGNKAMQVFNGVYLVNLSDTQATDTDLANLQAMTEIERLNLSNTQITDAGLDHLEGLDNLAALDLSGTKVTDAGLIHLRGLSELQFLYLDDTKVTDAGLLHLEKLKNLRELFVEDTRVTDAGIEAIKSELPNLTVSW